MAFPYEEDLVLTKQTVETAHVRLVTGETGSGEVHTDMKAEDFTPMQLYDYRKPTIVKRNNEKCCLREFGPMSKKREVSFLTERAK